jgi:hypothetical protein
MRHPRLILVRRREGAWQAPAESRIAYDPSRPQANCDARALGDLPGAERQPHPDHPDAGRRAGSSPAASASASRWGAMAREPRVLLFEEPLSNLGAKLPSCNGAVPKGVSRSRTIRAANAMRHRARSAAAPLSPARMGAEVEATAVEMPTSPMSLRTPARLPFGTGPEIPWEPIGSAPNARWIPGDDRRETSRRLTRGRHDSLEDDRATPSAPRPRRTSIEHRITETSV